MKLRRSAAWHRDEYASFPSQPHAIRCCAHAGGDGARLGEERCYRATHRGRRGHQHWKHSLDSTRAVEAARCVLCGQDGDQGANRVHDQLGHRPLEQEGRVRLVARPRCHQVRRHLIGRQFSRTEQRSDKRRARHASEGLGHLGQRPQRRSRRRPHLELGRAQLLDDGLDDVHLQVFVVGLATRQLPHRVAPEVPQSGRGGVQLRCCALDNRLYPVDHPRIHHVLKVAHVRGELRVVQHSAVRGQIDDVRAVPLEERGRELAQCFQTLAPAAGQHSLARLRPFCLHVALSCEPDLDKTDAHTILATLEGLGENLAKNFACPHLLEHGVGLAGPQAGPLQHGVQHLATAAGSMARTLVVVTTEFFNLLLLLLQ
eukprot:scaffold1415_cov117-Isochrysis_galbana.AAC.13